MDGLAIRNGGYRLVGMLNLLLGVLTLPIPAITLLVVIPKMQLLYREFNADYQINFITAYALQGALVLLALINIAIGVKNLTGTSPKYIKTGILCAAGTLLLGVLLGTVSYLSFVTPIYSLTSSLNEPETTQKDLSVTVLQTRYGVDGVPEPTYPSAVTVDIPAQLIDQVSAYGAAGRMVLGPTGWTGEGSVGTDGNTFINLYPVGGSASSGERIEIVIASPGIGSGLLYAAPYSPWLQSHGSEVGVMVIPPLVLNLKLTPVTNYVSRYALPDTQAGLKINGVVYSDVQNHTKDWLWKFYRMETVLAQEHYGLSDALLEDFIDRQNLNIK
jgi:hypothetical protein